MVALCIAATACGSSRPVGSDSGPLLTHGFTADQGFPMAGIGGLLRISAECVTIETDAERYVVLWPSWYRLEDNRIVDGNGGLIGKDGTPVLLGGGEVDPFVVAPEMLDRIEACDHTRTWLVSP